MADSRTSKWITIRDPAIEDFDVRIVETSENDWIEIHMKRPGHLAGMRLALPLRSFVHALNLSIRDLDEEARREGRAVGPDSPDIRPSEYERAIKEEIHRREAKLGDYLYGSGHRHIDPKKFDEAIRHIYKDEWGKLFRDK